MFSIICYVVAGFFFHTVATLAFIRAPSFAAKAAIIGGFLLPALLALLAGLALTGFRQTRRDIGIVLLSSCGLMLCGITTVVCMLISEDLKGMMPPETRNALTDYVPGVGFLILLLVGGLVSLWAGLKKSRMPSESAN